MAGFRPSKGEAGQAPVLELVHNNVAILNLVTQVCQNLI